jgi:hypothetical protein
MASMQERFVSQMEIGFSAALKAFKFAHKAAPEANLFFKT